MLGRLSEFEIDGAQARVEEVTPNVAQLLRRAYLVLDSDAAAARRELQRALELLSEAPPETEVKPSGLRQALAPWQALRVVDYIKTNLETPIRVEDMAAVTRLSTSYFFRAFRRSLGVSPHAYVVVLRLARARELLARSDEPLSQIAAACGFADQAHFSRVFHRNVGRAPGIWRRERRGLVTRDTLSGLD